MTIRTVLLFSSVLTSGLMAGLLFGWVVSVIPGLANVSDRTYVSTMRSINVAIVNPLFVITFIGTGAVLAFAALAHFRAGESRRAWWLAAAALTYGVGVLGVTSGANIGLNNALDRFELAGADELAIAEQRRAYETPWNRWHNVRTIASIAALSMTAGAALTGELAP